MINIFCVELQCNFCRSNLFHFHLCEIKFKIYFQKMAKCLVCGKKRTDNVSLYSFLGYRREWCDVLGVDIEKLGMHKKICGRHFVADVEMKYPVLFVEDYNPPIQMAIIPDTAKHRLKALSEARHWFESHGYSQKLLDEVRNSRAIVDELKEMTLNWMREVGGHYIIEEEELPRGWELPRSLSNDEEEQETVPERMEEEDEETSVEPEQQTELEEEDEETSVLVEQQTEEAVEEVSIAVEEVSIEERLRNRTIKCAKPGITEIVLQTLNSFDKSVYGKYVCISSDELNVCNPANHTERKTCIIFAITEVTEGWHYILGVDVAFKFSTSEFENMLWKYIELVESGGFHVIACCTDQNLAAKTIFGRCSQDEDGAAVRRLPQHPNATRLSDIIFLMDLTHVLNTVRQCFINDKFQNVSGSFLTSTDIMLHLPHLKTQDIVPLYYFCDREVGQMSSISRVFSPLVVDFLEKEGVSNSSSDDTLSFVRGMCACIEDVLVLNANNLDKLTSHIQFLTKYKKEPVVQRLMATIAGFKTIIQRIPNVNNVTNVCSTTWLERLFQNMRTNAQYRIRIDYVGVFVARMQSECIRTGRPNSNSFDFHHETVESELQYILRHYPLGLGPMGPSGPKKMDPVPDIVNIILKKR